MNSSGIVKKPKGLRFHFISRLVITGILLAGVLFYFFNSEQKRTITTAHFEKGTALAESLAANSEYGLITGDRLILENLLGGLKKQHDVAYVFIVEKKEKGDSMLAGFNTLSASLPEPAEVREETASRTLEIGRGMIVLDVLAPITLEQAGIEEEGLFTGETPERVEKRGKVIGYVRLGMSLERHIEKLERVNRRTMLLIGLFILAFSLYYYYHLTTEVINPINIFVRGTEEIRGGNLDHRIRIESENEIKMLGEAFNLTMDGRQAAEAELRKSEEKYRRLIESATDAIFIADAAEERIIDANRQAEELLGYPRSRIIGMHYLELHPAEDADAMREGFRKASLTGKLKVEEASLLHSSGRKIPVSFTAGLIDLGGRKIIQGIFRDITERKVAEESLKKLNNAIEQTEEVIIVTDTAGNIEYVNPAMERVTGYTRAELLGRNMDIVRSGVHGEEVYRDMWSRLEAGMTWHGEFVNRNKSGALYEVEATISPIVDRDGKVTHLVGVQRDITEQKKMRKQLIQSEKLSSIGRLVAGIAHELNNPLTTILGFSEDLSEYDALPEDVKRDISIVAEEARRSAGIVQNLLNFSRQYEPRKAPLHIHDVLDSTIALQEYRFRNDNIAVRKEYAAGIPPVLGDAGRLQQVFMNIITNAHQAMADANGKGTLTVRTMLGNKEVKVIFENDGPPIEKEHFDNLFDPFFTTKEVGEGTGLGLYILYGIVTEHGGRVWAENMADPPGVRFTITLPFATSGENREKTEADSMSLPPGKRVLVVEDEEHVREWLKRSFARNELEVREAGNGEEAIEILTKHDFDIVLADVKMEKLGGLELGRWIALNRPEYMKRLVLITGSIAPDVEEFCKEHGCECMMKPIGREALFRLLQRVIDAG